MPGVGGGGAEPFVGTIFSAAVTHLTSGGTISTATLPCWTVKEVFCEGTAPPLTNGDAIALHAVSEALGGFAAARQHKQGNLVHGTILAHDSCGESTPPKLPSTDPAPVAGVATIGGEVVAGS